MISEHFREEEFKCKCGCGKYIHNTQLVVVLERVREYFDSPVLIHSSTRCKSHNAEVGGKPNSKHLLGLAADIAVKGVEPEVVHKYLERKYPHKYGIGLYDTFVHIDAREDKARW